MSLAPAFAVLSCLGLVACASSPPPERPPVSDRDGSKLTTPASDATAPALRLPSDVRPLLYMIDLAITPGEARFGGTVRIEVELDRPRRILWLHGKGLSVTRARVGERDVAYTEAAGDEGFASLSVPPDAPPFAAGKTTLTLAWEAPMSHGGDSVFDVEEDGRHYTLTTFEPISARVAMPCFDEPSFKVPIDLTLTIPRDDVALANAPEAAREDVDATHARVRFARTAPLPTYLFAFAVGPFDVVSAPPVAPVAGRPEPLPVRGVAMHGKGARLAYELTQLGPTIEALERWFGRPYPYAKLDVIAVPGYPGAMENAALITFLDYWLFVDPAAASLEQRMEAASSIAHELAHQWFGNLVTMAWWDDLWLNEAFATWLSSRIAAEVDPSLPTVGQRAAEWRQAMVADRKASARRIRQPITSHHDMLSAFDAITYQKGANVIAMFEHWVGATAWQAGVRAYLDAHAFANATTEDLLAAVSQAAGRDVTTPFRTFLDQSGAPFVSVDVGAVADGNVSVTFKQARTRPAGSRAEPGGAWQVPVCLSGPGLSEATSCVLVTSSEQTATLPFTGPTATAIAPNADGAGYYQALVRPEALARGALAEPRSPAEAATTAAGYLAAFDGGLMPAADVLTALTALAKSGEPELVQAALPLLWWVSEQAVSDAERPAFAKKLASIYRPVFTAVGWEPKPNVRETAARGVMRVRLVDFMARVVRDPATRREALKRARAAVDAKGGLHADAVSSDLLPIVLVVAIEDDASFFDRLMTALKASTDPAVRDDLIEALASTPDLARGREVLALTLTSALSDTEMLQPLQTRFGDARLRADAWAWFRDNFDALVARLPPFVVGYLPGYLANFCDADGRAEVEAFMRPRVDKMAGAPQSLAEALETIDLCVALREAQAASARAWYVR